ncbi:MAG: hypothetical protein LW819_00305 [Fimbriimonadaceae bacterium]|jgi:hypothetical protein|nr:hypothetical protein [Fimbriimonadaceae bacterium]
MRRVFLLSEPANPSQLVATSFQQLGLCAKERHVGGHHVSAKLLGIPHPIVPQSLSAIIFHDPSSEVPHWWHTELNQSNLLFPYLDALFPAGDLHCRVTAGSYSTPGNMDALTLVPASQREPFIKSFEADPFALWDLAVYHTTSGDAGETVDHLFMTSLIDEIGLLCYVTAPLSTTSALLTRLAASLVAYGFNEVVYDEDTIQRLIQFGGSDGI